MFSAVSILSGIQQQFAVEMKTTDTKMIKREINHHNMTQHKCDIEISPEWIHRY